MAGPPGKLSIRPFLARPGRTLAVTLLVTAGLLWQASGVETDNTPAAWLPFEDPARDTYRAFRDRFGADTFILVATERVDLGDEALRERLLAVQERLAAIPGVVRSGGPLRRGSPVAHAREQLPQQLGHLARARSFAADDRDLLLLEARANAGLTVLLADDLREPANLERLRLAQRSALALIALDAPGLAGALQDGRGFGGDVPLKALPAVYWWAFARGAELKATGRAIDLGPVDDAMAWVLETQPDLYDGAPHLFVALRKATVSAGGDPLEAAPHFQAARDLSRGRSLLPSVFEAEHLAPLLARTAPGAGADAVRAAQQTAWDRFHELLRPVAGAAELADADPELRLANAVARERARQLLADPEGAGLIPPPGKDDAKGGDDDWGEDGDWGEGEEDAGAEENPGVRLDDGPLARFLIGPQRDRVAFLVYPEPDLLPPARAALVAKVQAELAKESSPPFHLAGPEMVTHDLDEASLQSFGGLFPLVLLVMAAVLGVTLRSAKVVVGILATAGLCAGWTVGLVALSGRSLNLILVVTPAILAVLTTAYALHLLSHFLYPAGDPGEADPIDQWIEAASHTLRPTILTSVTTAAGFFSLCTSQIPPVRDLGLFAGIGALLACALVFSFLPALLLLARATHRFEPRQDAGPGRSEAAAARLRRLAWPILLVALGLGVTAAFGLPRLRFESHVLEFFSPEHPLPRAYAEIEPNLVGMTPLQLWVEGPLEAVTDPETVRAVSAFLDDAGGRPLATRVFSPFAVEAGLGPRAAGALVRARVSAPEPLSSEESSFLNLSEQRLSLRATVACKTTSSEEFHVLVEDLRARLPTADGVTFRLSGAVPLLVRVQVLLVDTQLWSFAMALFVVTGILAVVYRSPTLLAVSLLPNVLPILLTLGGMGWTGIPLNTATVTVAGIALGLVVHDTIHFLHHHHEARTGGQNRTDAVASTLAAVGRPITTTTLAVSLGFGAFASSSFGPTFYFGVLIALTTVSALACDLLALPALLLVRKD